MVVRFSRHAVQRCTKRFGSVMDRLIEFVENSLFDERGVRVVRGSRLIIEGYIGRREARVVLVRRSTDEFTIVTAMWL